MKITKTQKQNIKAFLEKAENGMMIQSSWTSGSGRYITKRTLPPFVQEKYYCQMKLKKEIAFAKKHQRAEKFLIIDIKKANKILKEDEQKI